METTAYYPWLAPAFVLLLFIEAGLARWHGRPMLSFADSLGNFSAGVGAVFVGLLYGPFLFALYDWAFQTFALIHWDLHSPWPWVLGLLMADLAHYCHHRMDHHVAPFWAFHGVHHQAEELNFTVAMRHTWGSDFYSFPFYAALPLMGIPTSVFFLMTTLMSLHALATHSAEIKFPSFGILVTPQSHSLHHAKNPCYIDKNYGAMFCIWDKLFGTHVRLDPTQPPVYGTTRGYETHDGVWAQWVQMRDFLRVMTLSREKLGSRWRALCSAPGWLPEGAALLPVERPRPSAQIPLATKFYVGLQFGAMLWPAMLTLIFRDEQPLSIKIGMTLWVLLTMFCLGGLLDGRRHAVRYEVLRVVITVVIAYGALG